MSSSIVASLLAGLLSFLFGIAALRYNHLFKKIQSYLRWRKFKRESPSKYQEVSEKNEQIALKVRKLFS
jgi:hypothetical protein